jgi:hypothetical protein
VASKIEQPAVPIAAVKDSKNHNVAFYRESQSPVADAKAVDGLPNVNVQALDIQVVG